MFRDWAVAYHCQSRYKKDYGACDKNCCCSIIIWRKSHNCTCPCVELIKWINFRSIILLHLSTRSQQWTDSFHRTLPTIASRHATMRKHINKWQYSDVHINQSFVGLQPQLIPGNRKSYFWRLSKLVARSLIICFTKRVACNKYDSSMVTWFAF